MIGIGRVGSAVALSLAGFMFAAGLERTAVSAAFGACAVLAAALLVSARDRT